MRAYSIIVETTLCLCTRSGAYLPNIEITLDEIEQGDGYHGKN